jgi:hypothetical protein
MGRGGKPQLFFLGITTLSREVLAEKLRTAHKHTRAAGQVLENTNMPFFRRPADISDEEARRAFHQKGFTPEAAACMHYFDCCQKLVEVLD